MSLDFSLKFEIQGARKLLYLSTIAVQLTCNIPFHNSISIFQLGQSSTSPILAHLFRMLSKCVALESCTIPKIIQVLISGYIWLCSQIPRFNQSHHCY
jgi:hypothetical protein